MPLSPLITGNYFLSADCTAYIFLQIPHSSVLAFFLAVYWYDRRNLEQKLFLMFLLYLVNWISYGIALLPREILFRYVIFSNEVITLTTRVYFVIYLLTEVIFILCDYCVTRLLLYRTTAATTAP